MNMTVGNILLMLICSHIRFVAPILVLLPYLFFKFSPCISFDIKDGFHFLFIFLTVVVASKEGLLAD